MIQNMLYLFCCLTLLSLHRFLMQCSLFQYDDVKQVFEEEAPRLWLQHLPRDQFTSQQLQTGERRPRGLETSRVVQRWQYFICRRFLKQSSLFHFGDVKHVSEETPQIAASAAEEEEQEKGIQSERSKICCI